MELLTMDFAFQNRSRRPRPGGGLLVCSWSTMLLSAAMRSCCNILQIGDAMFSILVLQLLVNQLCNKYFCFLIPFLNSFPNPDMSMVDFLKRYFSKSLLTPDLNFSIPSDFLAQIFRRWYSSTEECRQWSCFFISSQFFFSEYESEHLQYQQHLLR